MTVADIWQRRFAKYGDDTGKFSFQCIKSKKFLYCILGSYNWPSTI